MAHLESHGRSRGRGWKVRGKYTSMILGFFIGVEGGGLEFPRLTLYLVNSKHKSGNLKCAKRKTKQPK